MVCCHAGRMFRPDVWQQRCQPHCRNPHTDGVLVLQRDKAALVAGSARCFARTFVLRAGCFMRWRRGHAERACARRQVVCCSSECICMCTYSICTYSRCVCVHRKRLPVVRGRALHLSVCAHTSDTCSYDTCSYAHMHIDVDVPDGVCVSRTGSSIWMDGSGYNKYVFQINHP